VPGGTTSDAMKFNTGNEPLQMLSILSEIVGVAVIVMLRLNGLPTQAPEAPDVGIIV
jgi:hypothetical protein